MENKLIILTLFLSMFIVLSKCFNIEVRDPITKKGEPGSYFGYSVAEHITDKNDKWLLVGAPLGNNLQPRTNHSGALFKCPVKENSPRDCIQVKTDGRRSQEFDYDDGDNRNDDTGDDLLPPGPDEIKDEQWMGVTVKSQKLGGLVMVCAHRYITSQNLSQTHNGLGLCYSLTSNLEYDYNWEPCRGRPMTSEHQQFGYCQAGTSLAFLPDGTALIGSPGPYTWRGTMFVVTVEGDFLDRDKNVYLGPLNDKPEPIDKYSYLGMSVTAGKYFDKNTITYASGAPRAKHHGQVYFFNKQMNEVVMNISLIINGEQFASNYGYELLSTDVNNDGFDDLLVAAPFFYNKTAGGAVYIYYNLRNCKSNCTYDQKLVGLRESRFGFSMTSLGDINLDGYIDVAIGAPYEEPNGAIYIYLGGKDGLQPTPSQIIKYNSGPKTLGYSLSGGIDMDDNHYPDLLSGAYESDMVILFRTRPIIHIDIEVKGKELKNIDTNKQGCKLDPKSKRTCFTFNVCFMLKRPLNHRKEIIVRSFIEADINKRKGKFARVRFNTTSEEPNKEKYIPVTYGVGGKVFNYCQQEIVYIKENIRDILTPIKFNVSYTLANNYTLSPILNKTSVQEFMATFQKDCGTDDVCQSNLILSGGLELEQNPYDKKYILDLGSVEEFNLNVNVTNLKESAYEAQLFIFHSIALSYIALRDKLSDIKCTYWNDTVVTCYLGNPFQKEKSVSLGLRFESKDNNKMNNVKELEFFVFVNSTSEELSKQTEARFIAEVKKRAEVKITSASTSFAFYGGPVKRESLIQYFDQIGTRVWHTYQVSNEGPWTVDNLEVIIMWPLQLIYPINSDKWLLYLEDMPKVEYDGTTYDNCIINNPYLVNKMNYTHRQGMDLPENLMMPPEDMQPEPYLLRQMQGERKRRDISRMSLDVLGCVDGIKNCTIECSLEKDNCAQITCSIPKLPKGNEATIKIKSRVSNSTLVELFKKKDFVRIISKAKLIIGDINIEQDIKDDIAKAETVAYHDNPSQDTSIPLWVIILAVLLGILMFLAIVFCLYKLGFFKRNRIKDDTLSANLKKPDEGEALL